MRIEVHGNLNAKIKVEASEDTHQTKADCVEFMKTFEKFLLNTYELKVLEKYDSPHSKIWIFIKK